MSGDTTWGNDHDRFRHQQQTRRALTENSAAASEFDRAGWPIEKILPKIVFPEKAHLALPDHRSFLEVADDEDEARAMAIESHLQGAEKTYAAAKALEDHVRRCFEFEELTQEKRWRWQRKSPADTFNALLAAYNGAVLDLPAGEIKSPCTRFAKLRKALTTLPVRGTPRMTRKPGLVMRPSMMTNAGPVCAQPWHRPAWGQSRNMGGLILYAFRAARK